MVLYSYGTSPSKILVHVSITRHFLSRLYNAKLIELIPGNLSWDYAANTSTEGQPRGRRRRRLLPHFYPPLHPLSLSLSSSSPSVDRGVGAGIASCVNKHGSPRPLVSLIQPGTRRGGDQRTDATLPSLSLSLMFFLEFYSLLSTLSMYRREQRLRYHHPTVERVGERVDPLEGESAPRYWTVSSSARLSTVKGEGRVKKEREKELSLIHI